MKKIIAIVCASFFGFSVAMAEIAVGLSANFASIDTDGSETELSGDKEKNSGSESEDVVIPELFIEGVSEGGWAVGLAFIPSRDLGSKSRTDTTPTGDDETADAGTYTASAELKGVVQIYTDIPIGPIYAKLGVSRAQIKTTESSPNSFSYGDQDVTGYTVGLGYRGDGIPFMGTGFYKVEATYTDFDGYSQNEAGNEHRVTADTEVTSLKFSVGTSF